MARNHRDDLDRILDDEYAGRSRADDLGDKARRFLRYLSTRKMECWGFFAAGFLIATIF